MESYVDNLAYLDGSLPSTFRLYFLLNFYVHILGNNIECKHSFFIWHLKKAINSHTKYNSVAETGRIIQRNNFHKFYLQKEIIPHENALAWFLRQIKGMQSFWNSNTSKLNKKIPPLIFCIYEDHITSQSLCIICTAVV